MVKNYSYTYVLPLLSEQVYLDLKILKTIQNTYLFTNINNKPGKLYILCKYNYKDPKYSIYEDRLISNELFVESYDIKDKVLYEFNIPKVYLFENVKFINGKYSLYKKDAKNLILTFWTEMYGNIHSFVTGNLLKIKQILFKEEILRKKLESEYKVKIDKDSELGNKIDISKETFIFEDEDTKIKLTDLKTLFKQDE